MDDDDDDEQGDGSHDECNKATEVHGVADVDVPLPHAIGGDHASDHTSSSSSSVASSSASAEPTFKYARVEGTVAQLVLDDALSCVAVSDRLMVGRCVCQCCCVRMTFLPHTIVRVTAHSHHSRMSRMSRPLVDPWNARRCSARARRGRGPGDSTLPRAHGRRHRCRCGIRQ